MKTLVLALTLAAATVTGAAMAPLPAQANDGVRVFEIIPDNRAQTRILRRGLAQIAAQEEARSGAHAIQTGSNNAAAIGQNGRRSTALIHQQGNGHTGSVTQTGNNNVYGLFQIGENTDYHVTQTGRGARLTIVIGN